MSLALLASLALSAKPPVYDKPLPPPPPLPVEVSQAYPGCFALGNGGEFINLNAICNSQPVTSRPVVTTPPPAPTTTRKFTNDEIYILTFPDWYCGAIALGYDSDTAIEITTREIVERVFLIGNPDQDPIFTDEARREGIGQAIDRCG